jgi:hypothetical protein
MNLNNENLFDSGVLRALSALTEESDQQRKFLRGSSLFFLKECENFWAWIKEASAEELELYATSDGYFAAFLDMINKRKQNIEYLRSETRRLAACKTVPDLMLDDEASTKIAKSSDPIREILIQEANDAADFAEDKLINELLKSLKITNNELLS